MNTQLAVLTKLHDFAQAVDTPIESEEYKIKLECNGQILKFTPPKEEEGKTINFTNFVKRINNTTLGCLTPLQRSQKTPIKAILTIDLPNKEKLVINFVAGKLTVEINKLINGIVNNLIQLSNFDKSTHNRVKKELKNSLFIGFNSLEMFNIIAKSKALVQEDTYTISKFIELEKDKEGTILGIAITSKKLQLESDKKMYAEFQKSLK